MPPMLAYFPTMPKRSSTFQPAATTEPVIKTVVDAATGNPITDSPQPVKNQAAVMLGRLGGIKGGPARAAKLSPKKRKAIAKKAAEARWSKGSSSHGKS